MYSNEIKAGEGCIYDIKRQPQTYRKFKGSLKNLQLFMLKHILYTETRHLV